MSALYATSTYRVLPDWVFDKRVPGDCIKLFGILLSYARGEESAFPAIKTLADRMDTSENTVRKLLKDLAALGMILVIARNDPGGRQTTNKYYLYTESKAPWVLSEGSESWRGEGAESCTPIKDYTEGKRGDSSLHSESQPIILSKKKKPKTEPIPIPEALSKKKGFTEAWATWLKYKKERDRKPPTQQAQGMQLKKLLEAEDPVAWIEHSIECNYVTVYAPPPNKRGQAKEQPFDEAEMKARLEENRRNMQE